MTIMDLKDQSPVQLNAIKYQMMVKDNTSAVHAISVFEKFFNKVVTVTKGRKVPIGTTGTVFWLGSYDNSKHGDQWGIYTTFRCGIRDSDNNIYWTSVNNIELVAR